MKFFVLSIFAMMLSFGLYAQRTPSQMAQSSINMEQKRTGNTLSEQQVEKMRAVFIDHFTSVVDGKYSDPKDMKEANSKANAKILEIFTEEQKAARTAYFKELAAKRAAAKQ